MMRILITNISANAKRDRTKKNHEQSISHISINNYILKNFKINYEKKLIIELWHNKRSTYLHIKMRNNRRGSTFCVQRYSFRRSSWHYPTHNFVGSLHKLNSPSISPLSTLQPLPATVSLAFPSL